jgi:cysteine desulfurase
VLPVSPAGHVAAGAVAEAGADLLALALVNAETGIALDAAALAEPVRARGGLVHLDAAQAAGTVPLDVRALGVDLLALSGPKVGGPAGTGALWVRRGVALAPLLRGGPQERELRAGTESVPALAGFAAALAAAVRERAAEAARLAALTARLRAGVAAVWPGARFAGADEGEGARAPHILSVTFPGLDGESLVAALDLEGVAASAGSACAAGAIEPSHVLMAMGRSREEARSALRLSLGWASTAADVTGILEALARVAERVRTRERESPWRARAS